MNLYRLNTNISIIMNWYITKFSRDLCLPSLPAIAIALNTKDSYVKYTVSFYFLAMGISRFIFTPLSDMYGRRTLILWSLPVFIAGSAICAFSPDIITFITGRMLQAFGIGCVTALGWAMIGDVYGAEESTKALAYLSTFAMWAPALASILGGHLQTWFGWHASFYFLTVSGALLYAQTLYGLKETNQQLMPKTQILKQVIHNYALLMVESEYWRYIMTFSLTFSGTVVYYSTAPFLFINTMHIPPQIYGYFSIATVVGLVSGKLISIQTVTRYSVDLTLLVGVIVSAVGGALLIMLMLLFKPPQLWINVLMVLLPTLIYFMGNGMMSSTSKAGTVTLIPGTAGTAAALFGLVQGIAASGAGIAASHMPNRSGLGMGVMFLLISILAMISMWVFKPNKPASE
ncbi:MAG: multidrug effflux MFS transporter [Legionellales bacterium]|nr:multidrug effflux MFS transporter [Legionellales bacterium]